ncbi:MAG: hypothetical protein F6K31_27690 [Symploca sp. SIO2G7]|nr:hypothetical protein [Symploca sp. SIO2G7]
MIQHNLPWLISIFFPFLFELITSITIVLLWLFVIFYLVFLKGVYINNLDLIIFIYLTLSWLYAVYIFIRHGTSIPKSLLIKFPLFLKNVIWKTLVILSVPFILILMLILIYLISRSISTPLQSLFKVPVEITQLETIQSDLDIVTETVNDAIDELKLLDADLSKEKIEHPLDSKWNEFSNYPQANQIPRDREGIEVLSEKYQSFFSEFKSRQLDASEDTDSISRLQGTLGMNNKRLADIEEELNALCNSIDYAQKKSDCLYDLEKVLELKTEINSALGVLTKSRLTLELIKTNYNIPNEVLEAWKVKIEEALARFEFNEKDVIEWLSAAKKEYKSADNKRLNSKNIKKNFTTKKGRYSKLIKQKTPEQISNLSTDIERVEKQFQDPTEVKLIKMTLKKVENNNVNIENLEQQINQLDSEMKSLKSEVRSNLESLGDTKSSLDNLSVRGNLLLVGAYNNPTGNKYEEKILKQQEIINKLYQEFNSLETEWQELVYQVNNDVNSWQLNLNKTVDLIKKLKARNEKIESKLNKIIFRLKIIQYISALGGVGSFLLLTVYYYRIIMIKRFKNLGNNWIDLEATITNSKELRTVRLKAVDIVKDQTMPNKQTIDKIKSVIKNLYKSKIEDDIYVAAELNKVAESLELRLAEQRNLG